LRHIDKSGKKITPPKYGGWELDKWFPNYSNLVKELIDDLREFSYKGCWPGAKPFVRNYKLDFAPSYNRSQLKEILSRFIYNCFSSFLKQNNKTVFADDNTWSLLFASELLELIPKSKIIHIVRDPRDVISSFMQQRWTPADGKQSLRFYSEIINKWLQIRKQLPPKFIY
jgi:hypothetical protein